MSYFEEKLNSDQSLQEMQHLVESIYGWMDKYRYHSKQTMERFSHIQATLEDRSRNILFLAEFSRGKTELINATIFGDQGARFLPSSPGRTTRCTAILQYDEAQLPSIKLLPTLATSHIQQQPVEMLLQDESVWDHTLFSLSDKRGVIDAFSRIADTELVSPEQAVSLGFIKDTSEESTTDIGLIDGKVPIPKWRHAIINYPHSLLKDGLRIIDTPGLNALGVEPELTLQALDSAHAIVFVVSADTGVTRSEMALWRNHVRNGHADNVIVVVNKIDLLWDELKTRAEIELDIKKQITEVARVLGVSKDQVYPVSAQKAMVGRARDNQKLINASGIQRYEQALADTINFSTQQMIVKRAIKELAPTMTAIRNVLKHRIQEAGAHAEELRSYHDGQVKVAQSSFDKVKNDVQKHNMAQLRIQELKRELREGYGQFVRRLDLLFLDRMIASYRYEISNQMTTPGLQREMNDFHAVAVDRFQMALSYVIRLQKKIGKTFGQVEHILDVSGLTARQIEPHLYVESLKKFQESHYKQSTGLGMIMTEQHILRDRYHATVMVKIRKLYKQTRDDVDRWCRTVLVPLELELKERAGEIKRRQASLERINNSDSKVIDEINDMKERTDMYRQRMSTLDHFTHRLSECSERNNKIPGNVINLHAPLTKTG